jgi:hypothetical protein
VTQSLEKPSRNLNPQFIIPFDNSSKRGWCDFHKRWEYITINSENKMFYSCGFQVPANIGLNRNWNKNQYEFLVDTDNFVIRLNEHWSWIDVYDQQVYTTDKICSKIIDFSHGQMYHPRDYDIEKIPSDVENRLMNVILSLCKRMFGVQLHVENANLKDFIKYPSCPEFSLIENKVDNIKQFNFRADLNLFKDFCKLVQLKETKQLRKDFHKNPESILLHAFAQYLGFTNSDAIRTLVSDDDLYRIFVERGILRFSIVHRSVYINEGEKGILNGLRLWVQNARTNKSESVIAKRFVKFFKETNINVIFDTVDIYNHNARNLPVAFHERILKEGFTVQMHDQLLQYFAEDDDNNLLGGYSNDSSKARNQVIDYDNDILRFEDFVEPISSDMIKKDYESIKANRLMMLKAQKAQNNNSDCYNSDEEIIAEDYEILIEDGTEIEDNFKFEDVDKDLNLSVRDYNLGNDIMKRGSTDSYYFVLPRNIDELYEISTHMRNCVGYLYRNKVLSKSSIIVVLIVKNKMKACFEIQQDKSTFRFKIVQAFGPCNRYINRKYYHGIEEWKKRHNISGEVHYKL